MGAAVVVTLATGVDYTVRAIQLHRAVPHGLAPAPRPARRRPRRARPPLARPRRPPRPGRWPVRRARAGAGLAAGRPGRLVQPGTGPGGFSYRRFSAKRSRILCAGARTGRHRAAAAGAGRGGPEDAS